jgi:hypothetical protein
LLVASVGLTQLLATSFPLAGLAAITLATITRATDPKPYSTPDCPAETMAEDRSDRFWHLHDAVLPGSPFSRASTWSAEKQKTLASQKPGSME